MQALVASLEAVRGLSSYGVADPCPCQSNFGQLRHDHSEATALNQADGHLRWATFAGSGLLG